MVREFRNGRLNTVAFCDGFEAAFNVPASEASGADPLEQMLRRLFDRVVLFLPYPADRMLYAGYRDEAAIRRAADRFWDELPEGTRLLDC